MGRASARPGTGSGAKTLGPPHNLWRARINLGKEKAM